MSSVLFLAHRLRARVNARVLARRKRDERRKMAGEGAKRKKGAELRSERSGGAREEDGEGKGARKANREDVGRLHAREREREREGEREREHMLGGRAKQNEGMRLHRRNALGRTEQDGPRENEISDGGSRMNRMDGRTRGKCVRICLPFFGGRETPARIDSTSSFEY